jgi:hypothetical protein
MLRVQAMEGPEFRKLSDKDMDAIIFKVGLAAQS